MLSKRELTFSRLELVTAHIAKNLLSNVKESLEGFPITDVHVWIDSTVVLHLVNGGGSYKQLVENLICKINSHPENTWRHVPTETNPADLAIGKQSFHALRTLEALLIQSIQIQAVAAR